MRMLLLILLFFNACSSHLSEWKEIVYENFPQEKYLKSTIIELDTAIFRYPFRVRIHKDKAVILDLHNDDNFYHLFTYPEFTYLSSFGKKGEAPLEMLSAENFLFDEQRVWALDAGKSQLIRFEFALTNDSVLYQEAVNLDKDLLRALDFAQYNDSTFIIPDYSGDNRFCWVNRQGKLLRKTGEIPSNNKGALKNARSALAQAWRSFIDYNPRNGILAAATQLGEVLEIYNLKEGKHVVRIGPGGEPEFQISQSYGVPTGIMGFSDVQVTDNAIYTVFHGRSFKEITYNMQKGIELPDGGRYIYVFSLEGEPLRKYVLDHYIYGISVNEEKDIILATDVNKDEPLIEYKLN